MYSCRRSRALLLGINIPASLHNQLSESLGVCLCSTLSSFMCMCSCRRSRALLLGISSRASLLHRLPTTFFSPLTALFSKSKQTRGKSRSQTEVSGFPTGMVEQSQDTK
jgi:hypothetical protein